MDCEIVSKSFATESFRNVADEDYISARCAWRMGLMNHFLWSSLQAIEKYLKAFLLFNNRSTKGLSHNVVAAYEVAVGVEEIGYRLPKQEFALLVHINR